jgi:hypothetical protein
MNYTQTISSLRRQRVWGSLLRGCTDVVKMLCEVDRLGKLQGKPLMAMGYGADQLPCQVRFTFKTKDHIAQLTVGQDGEASLVIPAISPATVGAYLCTICQEEEPLLTEKQWNPLNQRRCELICMGTRSAEQDRELDSLQRILELYLRPLDMQRMEGLHKLERQLQETEDDPSNPPQSDPDADVSPQ